MLRIAIKSAVQIIRYWWVIAGAMTVALFAGVLLSKICAETTWTVEASLVYGRLPIHDSAERLYIPPDLRTVTSLLKSASTLDRAIEIGKLDYSAHGLNASIAVEEPRGTQKIGLSIATTDPEAGVHVLDSVISAFQEHVSGMRRSLISNNLADLQSSLTRNDARMKEVHSRLTKFAGAHNVNDLDAEMQSLVSNVTSMDYQLSTIKIEEQSLRVQQQSVQQQLDQQKQEEILKLEGEKEAEAAEESLADNRRRQDRLNELIREERRVNEIRVKLDAKQNEYNRKIVLFEKSYLSKNDFEVIASEVNTLKSQILEGKKIDEWQIELERIDKMVVPKAKSKRIGSPIVHQTMFKLVELNLGILASQESQRLLSMLLAEDRRRLSELQLFQTEQAGLLAEIKSVSDERDSVNNQLSALQAVHDMSPGEFAISQTPSSNMRPPVSNRKKLFLMIFGGIGVMLLSPIMLLAVVTAIRPSLQEFGDEIGLPALTPKKTLMELMSEATPEDVCKETTAWCSHVALRLQQLQPQRGAVITMLTCSPFDVRADQTLFLRVAEALARRDEKVLLVSLLRDLPASEAPTVDPIVGSDAVFGNGLRKLKLVDYLKDSEVEFEFVTDEISDHIHLVRGGNYDRERLFSKRMTDFFARARELYSMIIVLGPSLSEQVSVEMIARHSEAMLLLHDRGEGLNTEIRHSVESLCELQAPIAGMVTRVGAVRRPRIRFSFGLTTKKKNFATDNMVCRSAPPSSSGVAPERVEISNAVKLDK